MKFVVGNPALSLQEWTRLSDDDPVLVSISSPKKQSKGLFKSTVVYTVRTTSKSASSNVSRSYKDFIALHSTLKKRFPGAAIPALPPAQTLNNKSEQFVQKRMHLLEFFLQAVAENPFLRADDSYEVFASDQNKFNRHMPDEGTSEGYMRWRQALEQCVLKGDSEKLRSQLHHEIEQVCNQLKRLKKAAKAQMSSLSHLQSSSTELYQSLADIYVLERDTIQFVQGSARLTASGKETKLENILLEMTDQHSQLAAVFKSDEFYSPRALEGVLLDPIRFELSMAEMFKENLVAIESKLKHQKKTHNNVLHLQNEIENLKARLEREDDPKGKLRKNLDLIQSKTLIDAKLAAEEARSVTMYSERGLLSIELSRYKCSRTIRIQRIMKTLSKFHLRSFDEMSKAFDGTGAEVRLGRDPKGHLIVSRNDKSSVETPSPNHQKRQKKFSLSRLKSNRKNKMPIDADAMLEEVVGGESILESKQMNTADFTNGVELRAKIDYAAERRDELDISVGDILHGTRVDDSDVDVWFVTNSNGETGLVPGHAVDVKGSSSRNIGAPPPNLILPKGKLPPPIPEDLSPKGGSRKPEMPTPPPGYDSSPGSSRRSSSSASSRKSKSRSDSMRKSKSRRESKSRRNSNHKHKKEESKKKKNHEDKEEPKKKKSHEEKKEEPKKKKKNQDDTGKLPPPPAFDLSAIKSFNKEKLSDSKKELPQDSPSSPKASSRPSSPMDELKMKLANKFGNVE